VIRISLDQLLEIKRRFVAIGLDDYGENMVKVYRKHQQLMEELDRELYSLENYILKSNIPLKNKESYLEKIIRIRSDFLENRTWTDGNWVRSKDAEQITIDDLIKDILIGISAGLNAWFAQKYFLEDSKVGEEG